jgi:hypothetical protein
MLIGILVLTHFIRSLVATCFISFEKKQMTFISTDRINKTTKETYTEKFNLNSSSSSICLFVLILNAHCCAGTAWKMLGFVVVLVVKGDAKWNWSRLLVGQWIGDDSGNHEIIHCIEQQKQAAARKSRRGPIRYKKILISVVASCCKCDLVEYVSIRSCDRGAVRTGDRSESLVAGRRKLCTVLYIVTRVCFHRCSV